LSELKRLVPAALEKSNSAKLEKAEILQMTVEHLKMVGGGKNAYVNGSSGPDPYEAHRIAVDYHLVGFKECAAEVARYLTVDAGLEIPEQARIRLVSHLQMFASQKECYAAGSKSYHSQHAAAAVQAAVPATVDSKFSTPSTAAGAQSNWQSAAAAAAATQHQAHPYSSPAYTPNCYPSAVPATTTEQEKMEPYFGQYYNNTTAAAAAAAAASSAGPAAASNGNVPTTPTSAPSASTPYFSPFTAVTSSTLTSSSPYQTPSAYPTAKGQQQPPYRPWGAEMASC